MSYKQIVTSVLCVTLCLALLLCSCGKENTSTENSVDGDLSAVSATEDGSTADSLESSVAESIESTEDTVTDSTEEATPSEDSSNDNAADGVHTAYVFVMSDYDIHTLVRTTVTTDGTPEALMKAIYSNVKLNSFKTEGKTGYVDMDEAYEEIVSAGSTAHIIGVGSVANSFLATYGLDEVFLTVNGKKINGHNDTIYGPYTYPWGDISGETATIYYSNDGKGIFYKKTVAATDPSKAIINSIVEDFGHLNCNGYEGKDIKLNSFEIKDNYGYIDMNAAYGAIIQSGTYMEWELLGVLVNSFLESYGLEKICLTVEGETLVTGHGGAFDYPLGYQEDMA